MSLWAHCPHVLALAVAFWLGYQGRPGSVSTPAASSSAPAAPAAPAPGACDCEVRTVQYGSQEAPALLAQHVERSVPLRIAGLPAAAAAVFGDAALDRLAGRHVVELRAMGASGRVEKKAARKNATFSDALAGGALASGWYAAQLSVPRRLPELLPLLGDHSQPLAPRDDPGADLGRVWRASAGEPLTESPYLYYFGGSADTDDAPGEQAGPALYMHYDAADNFVHVVDGWKEFWLYDPFQSAAVLYGSNAEHGNASPIDVEDPNATARDFPLFKYALPRKCTISAGEALYVPMYWFHAVRSSQLRTLSLAHFSRGDASKRNFFQKTLCGYRLKPASFECGSKR